MLCSVATKLFPFGFPTQKFNNGILHSSSLTRLARGHLRYVEVDSEFPVQSSFVFGRQKCEKLGLKNGFNDGVVLGGHVNDDESILKRTEMRKDAFSEIAICRLIKQSLRNDECQE